MTLFAVLIPLMILVGVGFYFLDRSKERHKNPIIIGSRMLIPAKPKR